MICGDVVDGTSHARNEVGLRRDFCVTRNTPETKTSLMVLELNARRIESVGLETNSLRQQIDLVEARIMRILTGRKVELCSVPPGKGFCSRNDAYSSRLSRMCVAEKATPKNSNQNHATFLN